MTADETRRRLVEIDDELRALPDDAFAARYALRIEQDAYRNELRAVVGAALGEASDRWAERAGRNGHRAEAESERHAAARIVSPGEGGGSG